MQVGSQWYNRIATEIAQFQTTLGPKSARKYKLDLFLRIAKRVDDFSQTCAECQALKQEITGLVQESAMLIQMPNKTGLKNHTTSLNKMAEHLKKVHKLVDKGHYLGMGVGIGMAVGAGIGSALGAAVDNPGIGTAVGVALGVAIGLYLDRKARQEGRMI
ncbi:MAG: hypothetical protein ABID71_07130 [Chloroflexota bacterium]